MSALPEAFRQLRGTKAWQNRGEGDKERERERGRRRGGIGFRCRDCKCDYTLHPPLISRRALVRARRAPRFSTYRSEPGGGFNFLRASRLFRRLGVRRRPSASHKYVTTTMKHIFLSLTTHVHWYFDRTLVAVPFFNRLFGARRFVRTSIKGSIKSGTRKRRSDRYVIFFLGRKYLRRRMKRTIFIVRNYELDSPPFYLSLPLRINIRLDSQNDCLLFQNDYESSKRLSVPELFGRIVIEYRVRVQALKE